MKKVIMIKIPGCPYCAKARKAISLLQEEEPYKDIRVEEIDETTQPDLAAPYGKDYYYVPSLSLRGRSTLKPNRVWTTIPLKKR